MRKAIGTAILTLALATTGSTLFGGTALAGVGSAPDVSGASGLWQSATTKCGSFTHPNTKDCQKSGGTNATTKCVNNGGSCTATSSKGTDATNNCVNINGSCTAVTTGGNKGK